MDPEEDLAAWRWRNYTQYLTDLGYDLHGGGAPDDGLDDALGGYARRTNGR